MRFAFFLVVAACAVSANAAIWRNPSVNNQGQACQTPGACVYTVTCTGATGARTGDIADIQTAVGSASRGDTIKLEAGCTWSTAVQNAIMLNNPPGTDGYVTITTTEDDKLPNPGTRITPAYLPVLPRLVITGSTGPFFQVSSSHEGTSARTPGVPAKHWRFTGLAFFVDTNYWAGGDVTRGVIGAGGSQTLSGNGTGLSSLVVSSGVATLVASSSHGFRTGDVFGLYGTTQETLHGVRTITSVPDAKTLTFDATGVPDGSYMSTSVYLETPPTEDYLPDDIVIDHIITTQPNWMGIVRRMLNIHARRVTIRDSFLEGTQHDGSDSQTIASINGSGPYTIENNYIGAASENIMFGGSAQTINKPMTNTVIRFNYLPHPPERYWTLRWKFLRASGVGKNGLVFKGRQVKPNSGTSVYIATNTGYIGDTEPDWSACQTGNSCTVTDGDVIWRRFGTSSWVIKNNFEIKGARGTLLSHNVFEYMWAAAQETAINIKSESQTKFPIFLNNCVPTSDGTVNTNGMRVTRASGTFPYSYPVPDTSALSGRQITINGVAYTIASFDAADSLTITTDAGVQTNVPAHYGALTSSPCFADWNHSTAFVNNIVRNTSRPFKFGPGGYARKDMSVGLVVRNNLMTGTDAVYWHNADGVPFDSGLNRGHLFGSLLENTVIEHNTIDGVNALSSVTLGDYKAGSGAVFRYNVIAAGTTVSFRTAQYQTGGGGNLLEHAAVARDICDGQNPCPTSRWDGNLFVGGNALTYSASPGNVWNLCGSSLAYLPTACGAQNANWELLFENRGTGDYRVKNAAAAFKRTSAYGQDLGADMSQLPEIRKLTVSPTDRMVLFTWKVTQPIAEIPCVLEVNASPDMDPASYAGELAQMGAWYRQDADDHDRNTRSGSSRMIAVGHTVNLTPDAQYYYRLQCGGDTRTGSFRTVPARTDASSRTITHTMKEAAGSTLEIEYGSAYSRAANRISEGGLVSAACASGATCPVTVPVAPGSLVYYRWKEKDAGGAVLRTGNAAAATGE